MKKPCACTIPLAFLALLGCVTAVRGEEFATQCFEEVYGISLRHASQRVLADIIETTTSTQLVPLAAPPDQAFTGDIPIAIVEPTAGVTNSTGLLVEVGCLCPSSTLHTDLAGSNGTYFADNYDVVYMSARYRANTPYDYGKFQSIDMYRAIGRTLELYPEIDRRRIYLYGNSGGGQVSLSMIAMSRIAGDSEGQYAGLFAGVFANSSITLISTADDVNNNGYESETNPLGWVVNNVWLWPDSGLTAEEQALRAAGRYLRSPQKIVSTVPLDPTGTTRYFVFHADADQVVDYQHFLDYRAAAGEVRPGGLVQDSEFANAYQAWDFLLGTIMNGNHAYTTAAADENTRQKAMEKYGVPRGFLSAINPNPILAQPGVMPELDTIVDSHVNVGGNDANGRGWRISGALNAVELEATTGYAVIGPWREY